MVECVIVPACLMHQQFVSVQRFNIEQRMISVPTQSSNLNSKSNCVHSLNSYGSLKRLLG